MTTPLKVLEGDYGVKAHSSSTSTRIGTVLLVLVALTAVGPIPGVTITVPRLEERDLRHQ